MRPTLARGCLLFCCAFSANISAQDVAESEGTTLRVMSWNMQSNGKRNGRIVQEAEPELLAEQMRGKRGVDIWGLSEVLDEDSGELFRQAASDAGGEHFELILGTTTETDKLAILYNADRLTLERSFELKRVQVGRRGLRAPLVARFRGKTTGQRFLFMVNHLIRGEDNERDTEDHLEQVRLLNEWTHEEDLPIIAVGDYNFDVEIDTLEGKPPFHEMVDGPFRWIQPIHLVKTQAADRWETILDFVFVANEQHAPGWSGQSTIMNRSRNTPAQRMDFNDDRRNSDHRPVRATFSFVPPDEEDDDAVVDDENIQVGSFNIELLGSRRRPFLGQERGLRSEDDLEELADRIAVRHDLEVVVLQEINTDSEQWMTLKELLAGHGYRFFEGTTSARNQFVVLAWDADEVTAVEDSLQELDIGTAIAHPDGWCSVEGLRLPVAGRFKAGSLDFWVVGVHLKSRSTQSSGSQDCNIYVRRTQCERIVQQVESLVASSGETDVLLVGDFNENSGHESLDPLSDAGFRSQMDFLDPESATGSYVKFTRPTQSGDLIDHVFIRFGETQEVVRNSGFVYPFESDSIGRRFVQVQSDHVPVWASFEKVDRD